MLVLPSRTALLAGKPSWALPGASSCYNWTKGLHYFNGALLPIATWLAVTCASTINAQNSAGTWVAFPANTLPWTDLGVVPEGARTNLIRNNTMQGAVAADGVERIANGTFVGGSGSTCPNWTVNTNGGGGTITFAGNSATLVGDGTIPVTLATSFTTIIGLTYTLKFPIAVTSVPVSVGTSVGSSANLSGTGVVGTNIFQFVATATTTYLTFNKTSVAPGPVISAVSVQSAGKLPNNWLLSIGNGLFRTIGAIGAQKGVDTIDVRIFGTTTSAGTVGLLFEGNQTIAASVGQVFANSVFGMVTAGSTSGLTDLYLATNEAASSGSFLGTDHALSILSTISSNFARYSGNNTLGQATVAYIYPSLNFQYPTTTAIDFTIRVGLPVLEPLASSTETASSPIRTTGTAATRAALSIAPTGPALSAALAASAMFAQLNGGTGMNAHACIVDYGGGAGLSFASNTTVQASNGTNNAIATIGGSGNYTGAVRAAFDFDAVSMAAKAKGGTPGVSANAWGTHSAVQFGNDSTLTHALNDNLQILAFGNSKGAFDGFAA